MLNDSVGTEEIWKPVEGHPLDVSSHGRVRSQCRTTTHGCRIGGKVLAIVKRRLGHIVIGTSINSKRVTLYVHRLVLAAFIGPCPAGMMACHRNGDATDNRPENLYWGTAADNGSDCAKHGSLKGERQGRSKLTAEQVLAIRADTRPVSEISKAYGVHKSHINSIRRRVFWQHI
jgi:hypothetical protein